MNESLPDGMTQAEAEVLRAAAKEELRKRLAAVRRALPAPTRAAHALAMSERLIAHETFRSAQVVLAYSALRFEIDPRAAIERAWALGKTVALPRTVPETRALELHAYGPGDALIESGFVVKEPLATAPRIAASAIDLVLIPGLGFDARGQRLGYGQGYYDRLLPSLPRAQKIGLAFELSLLVEVPNSAHDVAVDFVITEQRVLRCAR